MVGVKSDWLKSCDALWEGMCPIYMMGVKCDWLAYMYGFVL